MALADGTGTHPVPVGAGLVVVVGVVGVGAVVVGTDVVGAGVVGWFWPGWHIYSPVSKSCSVENILLTGSTSH